ncbi:hypothetical protein [Ramlibacter rhizophilus]|uniref:Amino acid transporter n=1 Tax=Ramlibacter rhizophilus TaxID=1781167 RepID=A0A4Z0BDR5_9BURK|nr:hypothetical protein [Ramlibacter rhizophilus]TFY96940.1 hypothetical protein EZ242_19950 [Ramlibacter rhizophilus]
MDFSHPLFNLVQWPAMVATVLAAWLVASNRPVRRNVGFWVFLVSNVMWVAWGLHASAWALITLQVALAALNIRGVRKTEDAAEAEPAARSS